MRPRNSLPGTIYVTVLLLALGAAVVVHGEDAPPVEQPPAPAQQPAAQPEAAPAQPAGEVPPPAAGEQPAPGPAQPLPEDEIKVSMDFRGVGVDAVLEMFSKVANVTILKDPTVEGSITILSPEEVTLEEAFQLLRSVLEVRGYALIRERRVVKIVPMERAVQMTREMWLPGKTDGREGVAEVVTELLPLQFVDAVQIQNEFKPLMSAGASLIGNAATNSLIITDTASNVRRLVDLVHQIDVETAGSITTRVFTVKHGDATEVANILSQLFSRQSQPASGFGGSRGGSPFGSGFGAPGGLPFGGGASPFGGGRSRGRRSGFRGSSSVAPDEALPLGQPAANMSSEPLGELLLAAYVPVSDMPLALERPGTGEDEEPLMLAQGPGGPGGPGGFFQRFMGGGQPQGPQSASTAASDVRIVADARSNSVIIVGPTEKMTAIEEILQQIDTEVPRDTEVRVFKLRYADATQIASVVSQSIVSSTATGSSRSGTQALPWDRRVSGQGGYGRSSTNGAVLATPETRTNSVIVTAVPLDMETAEQLITDLDKLNETQPTTFTIALESARASEVADKLNQLLSGAGRTTGAATTARTGTTFGQTGGGRRTGTGGGTSTFGNNPTSFSTGRAAPADSGPGVDVLTNGPQASTATSRNGTLIAQYRAPSTQSQSDTAATAINTEGEVVSIVPLATDARIIADDETNTLIIDASPRTADTLRELISKLDVAPAQVLVDVTIAEVTLDHDTKLGLEWSWVDKATAGSTPMTATTSAKFGLASQTSGFKYSIIADTNTFDALLYAMASDQRVSILSKPKVFTRNNQAAQINISQSVPYLRGTTITGTGVTQNNYEYIDVGIVLDVTPHVSSGDKVTLDVSQTANEVNGFTSFEAPIIATRSAVTSVTLKDGQTVVLGGIMKTTSTNRIDKVPLLGDLPVLGQLFRNRSKVESKTELMVFLRPRIVRTVEEIDAMTTEARETNGTASLIQANEPKVKIQLGAPLPPTPQK